MKYFCLTNNGLNIQEMGTQFQSISGYLGDIQKEFIPYKGKINFNFQLPEPLLVKKANLTTLLSVVMIPSWFLILKKDFIDFLKDFNITELQTWEINVFKGETLINDYNLFYLIDSVEDEIIDFRNSTFSYAKYSNWEFKGEEIMFSSSSEYRNMVAELENKDIYLKPNFLYLNFSSLDKDLIKITNVPFLGGLFLISEKLKKAIINKGFTGMAFQEIEDFEKRIFVKY